MTSGEICLVGSPYMILRYQPDLSNAAIDYQHLLKKKKKKAPNGVTCAKTSTYYLT